MSLRSRIAAAARPARPWLHVTASPRVARTVVAAGARPAEPDPSRWVTVREEPMAFRWIKCLDGMWWHEAPVPPQDHSCTPQTKGWLDNYCERCACGAIRFAYAPPAYDKPWQDRNSRKAGA